MAPTIGAPTTVLPCQAIDQIAITRPRICGALSSCSNVLAAELNVIAPEPTSTITP
jgi:hypothetical protein